MGLSDDGPVESFGGITAVLEAVIARRDLTLEVAQALMDEIFEGTVDPIQIAGLLTALRAKGETVAELDGLARSMLAHATRIEAPVGALDVVGTGGDAKSSVNISTMTALVVAACGVPVAKHGARAASGSVGAADLLEELGVKIDPDPAVVERCIEKVGMGFCFAQAFHPSMKFVAPVRRALGVRTVFNFLGPLANPAQPKFLVLGVADVDLMDKMAQVLGANGVRRAWVVRSRDGYDELSLTAVNDVIDVVGDGAGTYATSEFTLDPTDLGFRVVESSELFGGDVSFNARCARAVLAGERGAVRDVVVLNAAAALVVAGRANELGDGIAQANAALDTGRAANVLDELILVSNS